MHTPEFWRYRAPLPHYEEAIRWERRHLDLLLWWSPTAAKVRRAS